MFLIAPTCTSCNPIAISADLCFALCFVLFVFVYLLGSSVYCSSRSRKQKLNCLSFDFYQFIVMMMMMMMMMMMII